MRVLFINICLSLCCLPLAFGQLTEDVIKANFILNMAKFIEWEKEDTIERFRIGVLGGEEVYEALKNRSNDFLFKDKALDIIQLKRANETGSVHILYVGKRKERILSKAFEIALQEGVLIFSDSSSTLEYSMVNLLELDMPGSQFEINKDNIEKAGLKVPPKLLYYGGSEEDLRELYQSSEQKLSKVRQDLEQQTAALQKQREELELKKREIQALSDEIAQQEAHLTAMAAQAKAKQDSLDRKTALLQAQSQQIEAQQANIESQYAQLDQQKQEIEEGTAFLQRQKQEIEQQEEQIKKHESEILEHTQTLEQQNQEIEAQTLRIERQQSLLYLFVAFFALIAALVFFMLRAYHIKRQANRKLQEKNAAINRQKEEIQSQQEQLKIINRKIEKQNQDIKSSIHYALTIQQALLPSKAEMDKHFESFVLYRPKDIVSGDFYWMSEVIPEKGGHKKVFVAVGDCTGHGVPGAFLSMIGIKLLSSIVNERKQYDPRMILEMLNRGVQSALQQEKKVSDDGMDIGLCCIEKAKGNKLSVIYSGARRPLYYSSGQELNVLTGDRKTVGGRFFQEQVFTNRELLLDPGARLYLTSDGIADQNAPNRRKFGSKRLAALLRESLNLPLAEQKEVLENALDAFQQNEKQRDDISLLAIKL